MGFHSNTVYRCVEQINKASRGDLTPDELKERQVCLLLVMLVCLVPDKFVVGLAKFQVVLTPKSGLSAQAKGMQDPEIQNILTDPVMRQVWCMSNAC